jgi:prevent-host-death family protein
MTKEVAVADFGQQWEELINDVEQDGGEVLLTRNGTAVAKLVRAASLPAAEQPRSDGLVLYNGRWMIPVAAERERSIEHLRGSVKILGDIVSPIDDVEWDSYE